MLATHTLTPWNEFLYARNHTREGLGQTQNINQGHLSVIRSITCSFNEDLQLAENSMETGGIQTSTTRKD